jgi:transposase
VKTKLALFEREYICEACGLAIDRDLNAARNLASLASVIAASEVDTAESGSVAGRGADRKTPLRQAGGREASTRHRESGSDRDRPTARPDC